MGHFNKPRSFNKLQDLIQKIDQYYWEQKGELSQEISPAPKQEAKNDWSNKSDLNPHQNQAGLSNYNSHLNLSSNTNSKEKEKPNASQRRLTLWTNLVRMVNSPLRNASVTSTTSSV